jgi:excisionase family DNA binding protein
MPARDGACSDAVCAGIASDLSMQATSDQCATGASGGQGFEEFIGKAEVAKRLGLRPRTVDDWMKRGLLPYYKPGHFVRFRWSEVQAHLAQNCRVCLRKASVA